ncbi:MAG TPA: hypothetical protein VHB77_11775 [Planctomycetaceae bacterium]|nr:hypothetical protein [Planctomycetaceae bacterium]
MALPPAPIPFRVRIGVTGHRSLNDQDAVKTAVERLLGRVEKMLTAESPADSAPLEWLVISPLAKGADRIVARAVLGKPHSKLRVITPFLLDEYWKDFDTPEDHSEFQTLLAHDPEPIELGNAAFAAAASSDQGVRNEGYERVGQMVVDQCELLIAIWKGRAAAGRGGTAEIVQYAIEQGRTVLWIDANAPERDVFRLVAAGDGEESGPLSGIAARPFPGDLRSLSRNLYQLAEYNRDPSFNSREYGDILDRNLTELRRHAQQAELADSDLGLLFEQVLPQYARADQLAIHYQRKYVRSAGGLYGLAAAAVAVAAAQVVFWPHFIWLTPIEIFAMLGALACWLLSRWGGWHEKWLHHRHLAEQLRAMLFMKLVGKAHEAPLEHTQRILAFYRGPDTWVRDAYGQLLRKVDESPPPEIELKKLRRFLTDAWIGDQARWHAKNSKRKERQARCLRWTGMGLFGLTLVAAGAHFAIHFLPGHKGHGAEPDGIACWLALVCTWLAIILPACGAAVHAVTVLLDRERLADRSHRMARALHRIAERSESAATLEELREHAIRAEEVMATENLEWWISLSFREIELAA